MQSTVLQNACNDWARLQWTVTVLCVLWEKVQPKNAGVQKQKTLHGSRQSPRSKTLTPWARVQVNVLRMKLFLSLLVSNLKDRACAPLKALNITNSSG